MPERLPILYVDDEDSALVIFKAAFEDDYELHLASSAREALDILSDQPIHLVIADQRMPGMTGVQLLEVIRAERPQVGRMILTGYSDLDTVLQAINTSRVHHYATKPWNAKELRVVIDRALESYELQRRTRRLQEQLKQKVAREREIRRVFQRYAPEEVVDTLLGMRPPGPLLGERRVVAVVSFSVHGFDTLCARLPAPRVVTFLNQFLSAMHPAVARHRGTLVDNTIAVFGAPVSRWNNAENAVAAGLDMLRSLEDFNLRLAHRMLGRAVSIGIAIHHGEAVTGAVGCHERMEYAVLGDAVDGSRDLLHVTTEAARDTGVASARASASDLLVTRDVLDQTRHLIEVEPLPAMVLSGRHEPTDVYRVRAP